MPRGASAVSRRWRLEVTGDSPERSSAANNIADGRGCKLGRQLGASRWPHPREQRSPAEEDVSLGYGRAAKLHHELSVIEGGLGTRSIRLRLTTVLLHGQARSSPHRDPQKFWR